MYDSSECRWLAVFQGLSPAESGVGDLERASAAGADSQWMEMSRKRTASGSCISPRSAKSSSPGARSMHALQSLCFCTCCIVFYSYSLLLSVIWHRWLGLRKSIWPVKTEWRGVGMVYLSGVRCRLFAYGPADATVIPPKTPKSLASFKSRLVLPFWYRLTQVVLEKTPLNRCSYCIL